MVSAGQNFLFQPRAAPLRLSSQAQRKGRRSPSEISSCFRETGGQENFQRVKKASAEGAQPAPVLCHHTGPAGIQEPVGPRRVLRAPLAEPRPQSLGPSPSLPPRSAIHAGLAPTAGPAGPRRDASLTFASRPGPADLPPPRPPLHPAAAAKSNAGFPRRPAVARRSREVYAVAAASRFRPPPQGSAQSPSQPIHNRSCVQTPPTPPRPPDLPIRCPDRRNRSQRVSS